MSFNKFAKKQIQIKPPQPQVNPFQIMENLQDKNGNLAYQYGQLLIGRINISFELMKTDPNSLGQEERLSFDKKVNELDAAIQIISDRLNTGIERLSNYALDFTKKQKQMQEQAEGKKEDEQKES